MKIPHANFNTFIYPTIPEVQVVGWSTCSDLGLDSHGLPSDDLDSDSILCGAWDLVRCQLLQVQTISIIN